MVGLQVAELISLWLGSELEKKNEEVDRDCLI